MRSRWHQGKPKSSDETVQSSDGGKKGAAEAAQPVLVMCGEAHARLLVVALRPRVDIGKDII
jgi:hypothetical protein